jgi:L-ascorbate metabolism protein UlaG (beta-lactamase superfamily)
MASYGAIEDGKYKRTGAALSVCRIDCCTFLVEIEGCLALFDPWINDPAKFAPLWGSYHKEPLVVRDLPQPDVLLISQDAQIIAI